MSLMQAQHCVVEPVMTLLPQTASATNAQLLGDKGNDTIILTGTSNHLISSTIQGGSQTDTTGDGADSLFVGGSASLSFMQGNAGNDSIAVDGVTSSTLRGGGGADTIDLDGATLSGSVLQGDLGNDDFDAALTQILSSTVYGDNGDSTTTGGGNDSLMFSAATSVSASSVFAGAGDDTIDVGASTSANVQSVLIQGNGGSDSIDATGSMVNATVRGGSGNDTLNFATGAGFNQNFYGDAGNDTLAGTAASATTVYVELATTPELGFD